MAENLFSILVESLSMYIQQALRYYQISIVNNRIASQMADNPGTSVLLKKSNEARLNSLFSQFTKGDPNSLKFSEFVMFVLDRCIVSNTLPLSRIYTLFADTINSRPPPKNPEQANKDAVQIQRSVSKEELINIINQLGKILYHNDPNYQDKIYSEVLAEKTVSNKDSLEYPRVMIFDDTNRKFLTQGAIRTLCMFQRELKALYIIYVSENYLALKKDSRILLNEREIDLQNKKMTVIAFLRFVKEAEIVPHLINIEHIEDSLARVVPASCPRQNEFFYKHFLIDVYSKDIDKLAEIKHDGDPGLLFFEFQFTLARMCWEIYRDSDKKTPEAMLTYFFTKYLYIRSMDQPNAPYPTTKKLHLNKLEQYHDKYEHESSQEGSQSQQEQELGRGFITSKQNQLMSLPPCKLDISTTLRTLDKQLPEMPPQIEIKQEFPPPFAFDIKKEEPVGKKKKKDKEPKNDRVIMGQQPPPPPVDKNKQQKPQAARKQMRKAGEVIPRVFAFRPQPEYKLKSEDYLQKLAAQIQNQLKPLSAMERGVMSVEPIPCIISQILFPPEVPEEALPYLEAAINSHNEGNFFLALQNYRRSMEEWKKTGTLSSSIDLFFEYTKGSVYVSAGHDDYALQTFMNCRQLVDSSKIQYLSPDRALPWCGIGETCYNTEEYQLAARSYLKARQIRQSLLGIECVDTATTLNNLGCCFFMLDRNKEALSYFKICYAVLQSQLGTFHQRTQNAFSNLKKSQRGQIQQVPLYRKLWQVYEKDPFGKKKKKKKGKKK